MGRKTADPVGSFWARVDTSSEGCWEWQGAKFTARYGYGAVRFKGRVWYAHRLAYALTYGDIPAGSMVMHSCDNPPCSRPDHLSLGTCLDNVTDMIAKGRARHRGSPGSLNGFAKLNEQQALEIHSLRAEGATMQRIGERFGVSETTVSRVLQGRTWRHVTPETHRGHR